MGARNRWICSLTQATDNQFIYQVKDARWQRVTRLVCRLSYPALTRFNHYPGRKLIIKPIAGRNPQTDDLSLTQRRLIRAVNVLSCVNQD